MQDYLFIWLKKCWYCFALATKKIILVEGHQSDFICNNRVICFLLRETPSDLAKLLGQHMSLDRRRLEEGFLLYASLVTLEKYNLWEQVPSVPYDRNEMVERVTREFNVAFIKRWGGEQ